ncbi:ANGPT2 [Mytilus coruscus]|uniref:ANGPT2 n=1 Tax=Mytilus coruscus TaxID=42192 RepID=A0A6J8C1R1_MYTCO|nr:ANGPT2 [Mytilus coruscus]
MPLVSNKLNAQLVAELDVTSMNKQLETYIRDDIESTLSEDIKALVKNEQDDIKFSMLQDYSSKLNKTKKEYDNHISKIVQSLEAKQSELQLEISDVNKNISESESTFNTEITALFSGFEQRQERLKLAMISEYLSKFQQSQDANNKKINDLANDLKFQFADLSQEFKEEFMKSTTNLQTQMQELEEWKTNVMATLNDTKPIIKYKDCSHMKETETKLSGVYTIYPNELNGIQAYCDMSTDGGGWTVIQRRIDGTTSFNRNWNEYREGFGDPQKEYWLGNKYLNILTTNGKYELRVDLTDKNNKMTYALYKTFIVSDENSQYKLTIGDIVELQVMGWHTTTRGEYYNSKVPMAEASVIMNCSDSEHVEAPRDENSGAGTAFIVNKSSSSKKRRKSRSKHDILEEKMNSKWDSVNEKFEKLFNMFQDGIVPPRDDENIGDSDNESDTKSTDEEHLPVEANKCLYDLFGDDALTK